MIDKQLLEDFLIREVFDIKQGFYKAGLKRAYLDFNRTLKNYHTQAERDSIRGKTTNFLENELRNLIKTDFKSQVEFDKEHKRLCERLQTQWSELSFGQCQKWINMTLKYWLVFGDEKINSITKNYQYFHIPLDSYVQNGIFGFWKKQGPWSKISNYDDYFIYQTEFRKRHSDKIPIEYEFEFFNNVQFADSLNKQNND